jgi:hypothetical protein
MLEQQGVVETAALPNRPGTAAVGMDREPDIARSVGFSAAFGRSSSLQLALLLDPSSSELGAVGACWISGDCASELTQASVRRRPCSALGHANAPHGGPVDCLALGNRSRAGAPESGARTSPTPAHERGALPVVLPSPAHITEPVLRHTALGICSGDGLYAKVCRHRFLSVGSICLASWSTGPRWA